MCQCLYKNTHYENNISIPAKLKTNFTLNTAININKLLLNTCFQSV